MKYHFRVASHLERLQVRLKNSEDDAMTTLTMDREFAKRFQEGLDRAPGVPANQHGRLTWVARQLEARHGKSVTIETVRKWSKGLIKPRERNMQMLAELFGVDNLWLYSGEGPMTTRQERKMAGRKATGAIHFVAGALMLSGRNAAIPREDDAIAREMSIDLYMIKDGEQQTITIAEMDEEGAGEVKAILPYPLRTSMLILVYANEAENLFYIMKPDVALEHGEAEADHFVLHGEIGRNGELRLGDIKIPASRSLAAL